MRKLFYILLPLSLLSFYTCDDGDIITVEFDFDKTLELCREGNIDKFVNGDNYVLYDTHKDPYESLILLFPFANNSDIFNPTVANTEKTLVVNGSSIVFNYRTYDGDPSDLICQDIPGSETNITNDYNAASGAKVNFLSTFTDDDGDGVSSELENQDPNGDGDFSDAQDTDGDGIPDYLDEDDDNDNVKTSLEKPDENGDGNIDDALDTDGDGIPNYLDVDDDGDGVNTINEDENGDSNLLNDTDETLPVQIARYLDKDAKESFPSGSLLSNSYKRTITVSITLLDFDLGTIQSDFLDFGTYSRTITK
ncbi:hypothetical protein [Thalassobellus suaedae]|uniref:Uncharacterized protein n=1 Tax=Thalassobellus suaedae TaxID=3074124 RepID=A0ABY9XVJ2_9FLAO|nr:hypothetical protein RHP51_04505 [Flavobacteriaceae bacterium HL-DH14]